MTKVIKNVAPTNIQGTLFNRLMNTGIFLSNALFKDNLKRFLANNKNHINLIFPYLDYALNYFNEKENKLEEYEDFIKMENVEVKSGNLIQNYKIRNLNLGLRAYLKQIQNNNEFPLFFVITNSSIPKSNNHINSIKIFDNTILLSNFKFQIIENIENIEEQDSTNRKICVEELKRFKLIIVRPDYLIEYVE